MTRSTKKAKRDVELPALTLPGLPKLPDLSVYLPVFMPRFGRAQANSAGQQSAESNAAERKAIHEQNLQDELAEHALRKVMRKGNGQRVEFELKRSPTAQIGVTRSNH